MEIPFATLHGSSGLVVYLNHPMREPRNLNDPTLKAAYDRLITETLEENKARDNKDEMAEDLLAYVKKHPCTLDHNGACNCHLCDALRLAYKWTKKLNLKQT